ncbi:MULTISPECIES: hypothetical protein [Dickeya]|uniref:Uncharacterized protein n=1 Tax=Dickeya fangzhongdai TaxID=1778540 RepID=A0A2K8QMS5_9GAMM|nr:MULTISPECIES: hypothetical protein [Dickeya]ATZ94355.1 hypothetical protein CVE23_10485 [Dickeya fangzhongdai]AYH48030.1 hypothetical protein B6N31_10245 [Dickeya fangzhongdai]MBO8134905.1 hypothetical protein [Dickeya fangzhongdai]QOH47792.1 hypothetical protein DYD82_10535 [Dickeya fangzhongdai]QOH52097.1 hypothetical protein DYD83_10535 [Dickeya fangzhongdai]
MKNMKIGIAEKKNAEIEALTNQVNSAQYRVNELTSVVTALTAKQAYFASLLSDADTKKDTALAHLNQAKSLVANVEELRRYSQQVQQQTEKSRNKVKDTTDDIAVLIEQLIFSVDVIEKLSGFVNRQKAANNVIPDDLVTVLNQATTDANSAVALTLTALQSSYATAASADEAGSISSLEFRQASQLRRLLVGEQDDSPQAGALYGRVLEAIGNVEGALQALTQAQQDNQKLQASQFAQTAAYEKQFNLMSAPAETATADSSNAQSQQQQQVIQAHQSMEQARQAYQQSSDALVDITIQVDIYIAQLNQVIQSQQDNALFTLIQKGYQRAVESYQSALAAVNMANMQLETAQADLASATVLLNSLTAGLGAAKAAAYAA